jgi:phage baseplate assembly protein W
MASDLDRASDANSFIGRGIAFPMRVDHTGSIAMVTGPEDIDRSIVMVLSTAKGERLMRPQFGCAIWDQLFEPINANTLGLMAQGVRDAINQWEPRVELEDVQTRGDEDTQGKVVIDITYRIRATNDRRNLVYPFYTIPGEPD